MKAHTQSEHLINCKAQLHSLGVNINNKEISIEDVGDYMPGSVMVQDLSMMANTYMNDFGCNILKHTSEELFNMGSDYFKNFFPAHEMVILKKELQKFMAENDHNKMHSFFQNVRADSNADYSWYLTTSKLQKSQNPGCPPKLIHMSINANTLNFAGKMLANMIEDNIFVRKYYHLFNLLTTREKEVICLIVKGTSSIEIADSLFLSIHTVNNHRKNIIHKLNIKSLSQLVRFAVSFGML